MLKTDDPKDFFLKKNRSKKKGKIDTLKTASPKVIMSAPKGIFKDS